MRISINFPTLMLIVLVTATCTPRLASPTPPINLPATEVPSLPDLIIKLIYVEMQGRQGNCVEAYTPYEIRVVVENIGLASAGPFVVDLNGNHQQVDEGLVNGQDILLHFAGIVPSGRYVALADVTNQVVERQEDNNSLSYLAPTPSPPPLCTTTPTPTP
jgi:subtilase family serine protease